MKITAQEEYGLRCLLRLARAGNEGSTIPEIAGAEGLSEAYVAKLLAVLRRAGLIESERGRTGGYRLGQRPQEIGLGSLLLVLGEPLYDESTYCEKHSGTARDGMCVHHSACSLRGLWLTLEQWIRHSLDQITLNDLLENEAGITELVRSRLANAAFEPVPDLVTLNVLETR